MRRLLTMSEAYRSVIARMNRTDGIVAIGVFVALLALYTGHEQLMLSGILRTRAAFNASQIAVAIIGLTVVAVVLRLRRQDLASVGLRREGLRRSLMLGLAAAGVLSAANVGLAYWQGARHLNTLEAIAQMTALFAFFAAEEELIFRGNQVVEAIRLFRARFCRFPIAHDRSCHFRQRAKRWQLLGQAILRCTL